MKNIILALILFTITESIFAQQLCYRVDSIRIISLPRNLKTKLSLLDFDVLNFEPITLKKDTIIHNKIVINEFIYFLTKIEDYETLSSYLDIRMLIFIYMNDEIVNKVSVDYSGNFIYLGDVYCRQKEFVDWIKKNVSTWGDLR